MTYYLFVTMMVFFGATVPIYTSVSDLMKDNDRYDVSNAQIYRVEGNSMRTLGFANGVLVNVVPVNDVHVGDIIAFGCNSKNCEGDYIKRVVQKQGFCYWLEGRNDMWRENGIYKESLDSRTTYGWLCNDEIKIYGVAFLKGFTQVGLN